MNGITIRRYVPVINGCVSIPDKQIEYRNRLHMYTVQDGSTMAVPYYYFGIGLGDACEMKIYSDDVDSDALPYDTYGELREVASDL